MKNELQAHGEKSEPRAQMVKNAPCRGVDLLHINEPTGEFFTTPNSVLHHGRNDHSSPQAQPVLHREAIAELKNKIEKPVLRPGGEELARRARGEE